MKVDYGRNIVVLYMKNYINIIKYGLIIEEQKINLLYMKLQIL